MGYIKRGAFLLVILVFVIQNIVFGQLLRIDHLDDNGIMFKYQYDYEAVIKKNKVKSASSSDLSFGSLAKYDYNKNGQVINRSYPGLNGNDVRKYDMTGKLAKKYQILFGKIPDTLLITSYGYDEKGKINKRIVWYKHKTEYNHSDYTKSKRYTNKVEEFAYTNTYNDSGQLIKQQQFSADTLFGSLLYEYDTNGNIVDFKIMYKDNYINWHYVIKYDPKNRVVSIRQLAASIDGNEQQIIYNEKGQVIGAFKKIEYHENGLIKHFSHYSEIEEVNIVDKFKYEYYK
eukprot:TRINITY_DN55892_c0_g1_i1.p1 TRINITY_DN55892_c0_g1~~TRINITY_DN55892_c0_g1_i1.p1  ORF type:complete len:287 (-),score=21.86 TRINITY_DN55892_c0_g1_i1:62-922(-)